MVMVTEDESLRSGGGYSHELAERAREDDTTTLHERLVAYVHALDSFNDVRSGVWGEHSYARARSSTGAGAVRVLLGPVDRGNAPSRIDVESIETTPTVPLEEDLTDPPFGSESDSGSDDGEDDWEARLVDGAPHADHARLAADTVEALRRVRLARLSRGRRDERAALAMEAVRLRRALAPLWLRSGATHARPGPWLHAALTAHAPPSARRTYSRLLTELRRAVPRLAERLTGVRVTPLRSPSPTRVLAAAAGPWLVWVGGERWARVLGSHIHTRALPTSAPVAPPETWCATVAGSVRAAYVDVLAEAGDHPVIVGGCGWGASVARTLVGGAGKGARGMLLVAPALLTAEGAREPPAPPPAIRTLMVVGERAPTAGRARACSEMLRPASGDGKVGAGRVLVVAGADDQLRLPAHTLRRKELTQRALDAAIVEECVRWVQEVCESPENNFDTNTDTFLSAVGADSSEEEYLHLPPTVSTPATPTLNSGNQRSIEIVEGRVVSRGAGSTPLTLVPPRRVDTPQLAHSTQALAVADIMHMPIVFADDEPVPSTDPAPTPTPAPASDSTTSPSVTSGSDVTVTSGGGPLKLTRVILASRGNERASRPLLLRRGLRLVHRP